MFRTHMEVLALKATQADEGGLSNVNSWVSGGDFSQIAVNVGVTGKETHIYFTSRLMQLHPLSCAEDLRLE